VVIIMQSLANLTNLKNINFSNNRFGFKF